MAQPITLTLQIDNTSIQLRFDNGTGRIYRQLAKIEPDAEGAKLTFDEVAEYIFTAAYKRAVVYLKIPNALPDEEVVNLYLSTGPKTTIQVIEAFNSVMAIDTKPVEGKETVTTSSKVGESTTEQPEVKND